MQGRNLHARKERRGVNYVCSSNEEKKKYKEEEVEEVENVKAKKKGLKMEWNKQKVYKGETHRIIIKYDQFGSLQLGY